MSTSRPEQTPQRPNSGGSLQPRPAASYADLVPSQPSAAEPTIAATGGSQSGYQGWKPTRSPWPGYVAMAMVLIAVMMTMSVLASMMAAAIPLIMSQVQHGVDPTVSVAMAQMVLDAFDEAAPDGFMLVTAAFYVSITGMILGLVGVISGRGRAVGALAIVIGIIAPALISVYVAFTIAPLIQR